jgi:CHAD domain-containing protein
VLDDDKALSKVKDAVNDFKLRIKQWPKPRNRWRVLGNGVEAMFRSAGKAYSNAVADVNAESLHEWRKQTKYLRYQLQFLVPLWPQRMEELAAEADEIGELLGGDHDLVVLRTQLNAEEAQVPIEEREVLTALIDRRQAQIRRDMLILAQRFFQDRPKELKRRIKGYWKITCAQGSRELPV